VELRDLYPSAVKCLGAAILQQMSNVRDRLSFLPLLTKVKLYQSRLWVKLLRWILYSPCTSFSRFGGSWKKSQKITALLELPIFLLQCS